jgi:hypothetical protein
MANILHTAVANGSYCNSLPTNVPNEIQHCVEAFISNLDRTGNIAGVLFLYGSFAARVQTHHFVTRLLEESVPLPEKYGEEFVEQIKKSVEELSDPYGALVGGAQIATWAEGVHPKVFVPGFQSLMSAQLVSAWTAFEVLAADLWEACVNNRPRLGFIALGAEPAENDDDEARDRKRKLKYPFRLHLLRKWDYNLKGRMGTLLKGKWDFARRSDAAVAYEKAFGKDSELITNIFRDEQLGWLAAVRNAIVHNAGIADSEFMTLTARHKTLAQLKAGDAIPIDGRMTHELVKAVIKGGSELITVLGEWLSAHPE